VVGTDPVSLPDGGFYLWIRAPGDDSWALAGRLAEELGIVGSPGEFYGEAASPYLRLAVVQPDSSLDLVERRLAGD
jgi:aspartate/methionine/tyrosine aminotransferase